MLRHSPPYAALTGAWPPQERGAPPPIYERGNQPFE